MYSKAVACLMDPCWICGKHKLWCTCEHKRPKPDPEQDYTLVVKSDGSVEEIPYLS